jgi:hypothetical protein
MYDLDSAAFEPATLETKDVGPLVFASVDSGLTVVIGEHGVDRWPTPIVSRDIAPAEDPPLEIVRAPDEDALPVAFGAPMIEPDGSRVEAVERLSFQQVAALMRHRVEGRDGAPLGGGGGGRRRTKPMKRLAIVETIDDEVGKPQPMRYQVWGLTRGEIAVYEARPGYALTVLREFIAEIARGEMGLGPKIEEPPAPARPRPLSLSFSLFVVDDVKDRDRGLHLHEHKMLMKRPRATRRHLIQTAHLVDGPRVRAIDGTGSAPIVALVRRHQASPIMSSTFERSIANHCSVST